MSTFFNPYRIAQSIMLAGTLCAPPVSAKGMLVAGDDNEDCFPVWSYDEKQGKGYELPVDQAMKKVHGNLTGFFISALHIPSRYTVSENKLQRLADACAGKQLCPRAVMSMLEEMDAAGHDGLSRDELLRECPNFSAYSLSGNRYESPFDMTPYHARLAAEMTDVPIITLIWTTEAATPLFQPIFVMNMTVRMPCPADSVEDNWAMIRMTYDMLCARLHNSVRFRTMRQRFSPSVADDVFADYVKRPWRTLEITCTKTELFDAIGSRERWATALSESQDTPLTYLIKDANNWCPMNDAVRICAENDETWTG